MTQLVTLSLAWKVASSFASKEIYYFTEAGDSLLL
jgi:hypothetical protein